MNNITKVSNAFLCSNCGACKAICPKDCISFRFTSIGRMYAKVDENVCIDCGLCTKVCPSLDKGGLHELFEDRYVGNLKKVYVGRCSDDSYFMNAQSGGVCTALLSYMFDKSLIDAAVVTRMSYGIQPIVESMVVTRKEQLSETQKSCYTPVDVLSSLRKTKGYKSVAVVGLPCHIQGVVSLQKVSKAFANIKYLLGLICDRTLCKGIQDVMTSSSPINDTECVINWKRKNFTYLGTYHPYRTAPVVISYKSNDYMHIIPNTYRFALKEMFTAPRCRVCYDKINVFSDIVFGDPWRMGNIDEEKGSSVVAVRTNNGLNLIESAIKEGILLLEERECQQVVTGQLVDERRKSVALYSQAIQSLSNKIVSYLYEQGQGESFSTKELSQAKNELYSFLNHENDPIKRIIEDARKVIDKTLRAERLNKNIIVRILRKIKRTLSL